MSRSNRIKGTVKVVVTNCWSYYNKGDAAIALATVGLIRKIIPSAEVTLLAFDCEGFARHRNSLGHSVEVLPMPSIIDSLRPIRILFGAAAHGGTTGIIGLMFLIISLVSMRLLRLLDTMLNRALSSIDNADLVIAVGGNYLYSHFGFYIHLIPLVYAKFITKKKIALLGHSIGPFNDAISRFVAKTILRSVDVIVCREEISHRYVRNALRMNLTNIVTLCDMAVFLQSQEIVHEGLSRAGITVRKWLSSYPNMYKTYMDSMMQLILHLIDRKFEVYLIPFSCVGGGEDDTEVCKTVYSNIPSECRNRLKLLDVKELPPTLLIEIMKNTGLRIFIGTRMHSVILASLAGIPSVIISYQHFKAYGISRQLGLHEYVISIEDIRSDILIHLVDKLLKKEKEVKNRMVARVRQLRRLNEPRLRSLLLTLIGDKSLVS